MKDEKISIDTNIIVYVYDNSKKEKHQICKDLLKECWENKNKFVISIQNLSEFYLVTTKKITNPIKKDKIEKIIKEFIEFDGWQKLISKGSTILNAIKLSVKYNVSYWDSMIAAVMIENNINKIFTENIKDFSKIKEIEATNPLNNKN